MEIAPTPVLRGEYALEFERKIEQGLKKPAKLIPTPKIENARKLVIAYVSKHKE